MVKSNKNHIHLMWNKGSVKLQGGMIIETE